jgi:hypothetical protein
MAVLGLTVMVMVELPAPGAVIGLGLKPTVVPVGTPVAERLIALLNPFPIVVVIVLVPVVACGTVNAAGEADRMKLETLDSCVTPRKAIGVMSPVLLPVPTTTVSRVPLIVTCSGALFPGHAIADQFFAAAS